MFGYPLDWFASSKSQVIMIDVLMYWHSSSTYYKIHIYYILIKRENNVLGCSITDSYQNFNLGSGFFQISTFLYTSTRQTSFWLKCCERVVQDQRDSRRFAIQQSFACSSHYNNCNPNEFIIFCRGSKQGAATFFGTTCEVDLYTLYELT